MERLEDRDAGWLASLEADVVMVAGTKRRLGAGSIRGLCVGLAAAFAFGFGQNTACADEPSAPDPDVASCVAAHVNVQELRKKQQLLAAAGALKECTRPECPGLVQKDCADWMEELEKETPSVVFNITSAGVNVTDARVLVDDKPVQLASGTPVKLDPGRHRLNVEHSAHEPVKREFVAFLGQRFLAIDVALVPLPPKPAPAKKPPAVETYRPVMPATYALGAVTLVGLAGFATLGLLGEAARHDLEITCMPRCTDDQTQPVRGQYVAADVLLGVAAAGVVGTVLTFVLRPEKERPVSVSLLPAPAGVFGSVAVRGF